MRLKTTLYSFVCCLLCTGAANAQNAYSRSLGGQIKGITRIAEKKQAVAKQVKAAEAPAVYETVPFKHLLGKNELADCEKYTVIDANADEKTWKMGGFSTYSACLKPATGFDASDDWTISPAIELKAGVTYYMSYQEGCGTSSGNGRLEVKLGNAATVEAMTTTLDADHLFNGTTWITREATFTVEQDGYYYIGFHAITKTSDVIGIMKLSNFQVKVNVPKADPPAKGTLTYEVYPKGELKAKVSYTAATMTKGGEQITEPFWAAVVLNGTKNDTLTNLQPGETREFVMDCVNSNRNSIAITPYILETPGDSSYVKSFYAGADCPLPPTNAKAVLSDDGKSVVLSWDAVTSEVGENGGYVDLSKIQYAIFDAYGSIYDPSIAITPNTTITLDYADVTEQDFAAFEVTAFLDEYLASEAGKCYSNIVVVGEPWELPFRESFSNAEIDNIWGIVPGSDTQNVLLSMCDDEMLEAVKSQDGDNGFLLIMPSKKDAKCAIFSGKVNVSKAVKPVLEFYAQGMGNVLNVGIAKDGGDFTIAKTLDFKANSTTGWTLFQIPLDAYKDSKYVQMQFAIDARDNVDSDDEAQTWSIPLDNIRIRDAANNDLMVNSITAPATAKAGDKVAVAATVELMGDQETSAKVYLYRDEEQVATETIAPFAANSIVNVEFTDSVSLASPEEITYTVVVEDALDKNLDNNSKSTTVKVILPDYPMAENLAATLTGANAHISWTAPDIEAAKASKAVMEDFENPEYPAFSIDGFGDWTVVDGDKDITYSITTIPGDPYPNAAKSWQLFNFAESGLSDLYKDDLTGLNGSNAFLVAYSPEGQADDWLISPELSGKAQTISFNIKAFSITYGNEFFEVLYSTTDKNVDSFTKLNTIEGYDASVGLGEVWTLCKAALPEGAKYFAIRYTSYNNWAVMLDDVAFESLGTMPKDATIVGYNLLRNGEKVNDAPLTATEFDDMLTKEGDYDYQVSVVYSVGESRYTAPVTVHYVKESGINDINAAAANGIAYSLDGVEIRNLGEHRGLYIQNGQLHLNK